MNYEFEHIVFIEGERKPKTRTWEAWSRQEEDGGKEGATGDLVGRVQWYGPWRCYAFFPERKTIFERKCLRAIASFCEARSTQHRQRGAA